MGVEKRAKKRGKNGRGEQSEIRRECPVALTMNDKRFRSRCLDGWSWAKFRREWPPPAPSRRGRGGKQAKSRRKKEGKGKKRNI